MYIHKLTVNSLIGKCTITLTNIRVNAIMSSSMDLIYLGILNMEEIQYT